MKATQRIATGFLCLGLSAVLAQASTQSEDLNRDGVHETVAAAPGARGAALVVPSKSAKAADVLGNMIQEPNEIADSADLRSVSRSMEATIAPGTEQANLVPDDPSPPNGPGRIGERESNTTFCATASVGKTPMTADVTYSYEYRDTRDTNGDGKNDADPGWVLTDVAIRYLDLPQVNQCL